MTETDYQSAVAIIGMSGRFPGASGVSELWRRLLDGMPGLREITDDELRAAGLDPAVTADPAYVRVGGPVDGIDLFDAGVFGFSPRETETMEPQHRLFLECAWEALESAGYCPTEHDVPVGVFAGCGFPDYMLDNLAGLDDEPGGHLLLAAGSERDSLTSLVAYKLGLRGPSVTVQTFCSTSLVAVHMACQSLLTFECDTALAGGAALPLPQPAGYRYEQGGILSPDGTVRSFDAAANGSVMGSGVGVVALKRMTDALADGDVVHAVILGSAVNNDGPARVGYTAPGVEGQAGVIDAALAVADVKPETVGYVECHATGTGLGDAIELTAMNKVFPAGRDTPCVLGSLKPSIGHLDRASGVTGLIRATLAVREHVLPGTPNFETPNPALAAAGDRFTVLSGHRPWPQGPHPRRAGVSSFGLGGTNAHVVLEEAPPRPPLPSRPGPHVLAFSAADPAALEALTVRLRDHLAAHPELRLADVAHTLQQSRGRFALRRAVVCRDLPDAVAALSDPRRLLDGETSRSDAPVRLAVADGVPDAWWSGLASATAALAGQQAPAGAGRETAERLVRELLARLGVRVVTDPAADAVDAVLGDGPAEEWPAAALARLWLAGVRVDWSALHRDADGTPTAYRVELPTYPFQRRRYWTDTRPAASPAAGDAGTTGSAVRRVDDTGAWTYLPTWRQEPVPAGDLDARLRAAGPWLVLSGDARGEALIARLARAGAETTAVRLADGFDMDDTGDFTVGPRPADDLPEVFGSLLVAPRTVVHAWSLAAPPDGQTADAGPMAVFEAAQELGFHSALALAGALADSPAGGETELVLLTSGATGVTGADLTRPEHASLAALAPSLAQENPALRCRSIDVDAPPLPAAGDAAGVLADRLAGHVLAAAVAPHRGPLAVRAGETWLRHYEPVRLDTPARPLFREGETVLITGGLGDVGLTLARHLAQTYRCRLVLTTRGALPPREEWPLHADGESRTARHVRNLLDLEERGAEVLAVSADVADLEQMRRAVTLAVERFGGIDAVVHGAGVQDPAYFRAAHLSDREMCAAHFRAKVGGFHVLQEVLAGHCPERRLTLSSIAAVLGGIALGPYAAANAALDAFARAARRDGAGVWTSVDWDTWGVDPARFDGELVMRPHEGVDVFERALAAGDRIGQVVVSTASLRARLDQWVTGAGRPAGQPMQERRERHPRPQLSTPYAEPADELEASLAEVWASVLGLDRVGADDNFFELGGHSLLAIQVAGRIRETVRAGLPVTAIVEHPTVRELAAGLRES
ncbi:SDR family NAD(P)-dependent oxidoreductase [Streptomyces sp. NPDC006186]|uniref:SDR family NAD(P)-dependent oxidoreductase n=1 Tax=Streptomyces sp. NPDC006186 TaxID=3155248 RepID=UPI0033B6D44D